MPRIISDRRPVAQGFLTRKGATREAVMPSLNRRENRCDGEELAGGRTVCYLLLPVEKTPCGCAGEAETALRFRREIPREPASPGLWDA